MADESNDREDIEKFEGGVEKFTKHINEVVAAANQDHKRLKKLEKKAGEPVIFTFVDAGDLAEFEIPALRLTDAFEVTTQGGV